MSTKQRAIILCATLLFVFVSRFFYIQHVPTAVVHDELIYVMQAKALALTGSDQKGFWNPWKFQPFDTGFAELPAVLMVPGVVLFDDPIIGAKIVHLMIGIALPFLLGWLVFGIWKNNDLAIVTIVIASINPWLWQFSRMMFDSLFSLFFYLLAAGIILNLRNGWRLLSLPALLCGFFQYQGMKLAFLPWVAVVVALLLTSENANPFNRAHWKKNGSLLKTSLSILLASVVLFVVYIFVLLPQQSAFSRVSQIVFFDTEALSHTVNEQRRLSLTYPLNNVVSNKYFAILSRITDTTFGVLNPNFLFLAADETANQFAVTQHGYFYLLDFIFICLGLFFLFNQKEQTHKNTVFVVLLFVSLLPAVLATSYSFTFRASLFYILLIPVIAYGIYTLASKARPLLLTLLLVGYGASTVYFAIQYFTHFPVYAADGQFFVERIIANYATRVPKETKIIVHTPDAEAVFNSYLFYNDLYNSQSAELIKESLHNKTYTFENVSFSTACLSPETIEPDTIVLKSRETKICKTENPPSELLEPPYTSIPAIKDSGELYRVYNDPVCSQYELATFIAPKQIKQFAVEKLTEQEFCRTWFSNLWVLNNK